MEVFLAYTVLTTAFLLGPALASYFTVLVMRGEKFTKASGNFSVDDNTGQRLQWFEMVPILSFLALRGKSRYTGKKLDIRMFYAELIGGIAFAIISFGGVQALAAANLQTFSLFEFLLGFLVVWSFTAALLYLAIYDLFTYSIPSQFTLTLSLASVAVNVFVGIVKVLPGDYLETLRLGSFDNLVAGLLAGLAVWSVIRLTKQKGMGQGDVYIAVIMGLMLGGLGLVAAFYVTIFSGTFIGLIMMWKQKRIRGIIVPLVPFMLFGYAAGAMWSVQIMRLLFSGLV
jgi:leader peptidase (prepilin peptidase)/N-methyltransferase